MLAFLSGKDITHKLYSLNEHLGGLKTSETERFNEACKKNLNRSLSLDAVNTGRNGNVRSTAWRIRDEFKGAETYSNSKHIMKNTENLQPIRC